MKAFCWFCPVCGSMMKKLPARIISIPTTPAKLGHSVAADVRRPLYWDLFTGACGHTYGHHSVWQMFDPAKRKPVNNPLLPWYEALDQPGAAQMQFGRKLIESRLFLSRVPDDSVIVPDPVQTSIPGAGTRRFVATRDSGDSAEGACPISGLPRRTHRP